MSKEADFDYTLEQVLDVKIKADLEFAEFMVHRFTKKYGVNDPKSKALSKLLAQAERGCAPKKSVRPPLPPPPPPCRTLSTGIGVSKPKNSNQSLGQWFFSPIINLFKKG